MCFTCVSCYSRGQTLLSEEHVPPSPSKLHSVVKMVMKQGFYRHWTLSSALSCMNKGGQRWDRKGNCISQVRSDLQPAVKNLCCVYSRLGCSRCFTPSSERAAPVVCHPVAQLASLQGPWHDNFHFWQRKGTFRPQISSKKATIFMWLWWIHGHLPGNFSVHLS